MWQALGPMCWSLLDLIIESIQNTLYGWTSGGDSIMFARQATARVIRSVCNVHTHVQTQCIYEV